MSRFLAALSIAALFVPAVSSAQMVHREIAIGCVEDVPCDPKEHLFMILKDLGTNEDVLIAPDGTELLRMRKLSDLDASGHHVTVTNWDNYEFPEVRWCDADYTPYGTPYCTDLRGNASMQASVWRDATGNTVAFAWQEHNPSTDMWDVMISVDYTAGTPPASSLGTFVSDLTGDLRMRTNPVVWGEWFAYEHWDQSQPIIFTHRVDNGDMVDLAPGTQPTLSDVFVVFVGIDGELLFAELGSRDVHPVPDVPPCANFSNPKLFNHETLAFEAWGGSCGGMRQLFVGNVKGGGFQPVYDPDVTAIGLWETGVPYSPLEFDMMGSYGAFLLNSAPRLHSDFEPVVDLVP